MRGTFNFSLSSLFVLFERGDPPEPITTILDKSYSATSGLSIRKFTIVGTIMSS